MEMINLSQSLTRAKEVKKFFKDHYGLDIGLCYQCGKCAAGCPVANKMDYNSREVINLLKNGQLDEAVQARSVWQCASCDTCSTRCPRNVDPAGVMDAVRLEAHHKGYTPERAISVFHSAFLANVEKYGRAHEMGMMLKYNIVTGRLLKDADQAPRMFFKGKLAIIPHKIQARNEMKDIFERCRKLEVEGK